METAKRAIRVATSVRIGDSLLAYSPALIVIVILIVDASRSADPDLYGHLRFGQQILHTRSVPSVDRYSYAVRHLPWISHEWLSDVVLAWTYQTGGVIGLKVLKLLCSGALVIILAYAMREAGASAIVQEAILILASVRLSPQMQFRPQIFTYALLALTLLILTRDNFRGKTNLWLLVPIFILWANLHGGFAVGIAAVGIYALVRGAQDAIAGQGLTRLIHLLAVASACVLATLITPFGVNTWLTVLHTVDHPEMLRAINEWQPLVSATIAEYHLAHLSLFYDLCAFALFLAAAVAIAIAPSTDDLALIAVAAVLIAAAFAQVRNLPLGMIAATIPLAFHLSLAGERRGIESLRPHPERRHSSVGQVVLGLTAIALAVETGLFTSRLKVTQIFPAGALAFMSSHNLSGNVLCEYSWSDYLLFHRWRQDKVFIDSRFEMIYPSRVIRDYLDFQKAGAGSSRVLRLYPTAFVLIPRGMREAARMDRERDWRLIYSDADSLLFARADNVIRGLPDRPVIGINPVSDFP